MARTVIINKSGKLEVKPDEREIEVRETGVAYIVRDAPPEDQESGHRAYKLHNVGKKWYWLGLWNSICVTGKEDGYASMSAAIKAVIKDESVEEDEILMTVSKYHTLPEEWRLKYMKSEEYDFKYRHIR